MVWYASLFPLVGGEGDDCLSVASLPTEREVHLLNISNLIYIQYVHVQYTPIHAHCTCTCTLILLGSDDVRLSVMCLVCRRVASACMPTYMNKYDVITDDISL